LGLQKKFHILSGRLTRLRCRVAESAPWLFSRDRDADEHWLSDMLASAADTDEHLVSGSIAIATELAESNITAFIQADWWAPVSLGWPTTQAVVVLVEAPSWSIPHSVDYEFHELGFRVFQNYHRNQDNRDQLPYLPVLEEQFCG
jgi:hypothetical protein